MKCKLHVNEPVLPQTPFQSYHVRQPCRDLLTTLVWLWQEAPAEPEGPFHWFMHKQIVCWCLYHNDREGMSVLRIFLQEEKSFNQRCALITYHLLISIYLWQQQVCLDDKQSQKERNGTTPQYSQGGKGPIKMIRHKDFICDSKLKMDLISTKHTAVY